ncbi:MAG TPA: DUF485 domain-containing protein [Actinophytocola sp.]|uniref:DUF485 domain-containing protein n=1 Tax=Actinophytocola sp. TaxID=1872138 RepID=UPI002DBB54EB|nr:DUF485 domain-containing protein [Actinophytocola sp.]HEU5474461.1 DUF485 domain-containing protein [Actinophytocola sp.]
MSTVSSFSRAPETGNHPVYDPRAGHAFVDQAGNPDFAAIRRSRDFVRVQRRLTRFVVPATVLFLCWYMTYVLLAAYANDFMSHKVFGSVNVGLLLGLSQFVSTVVIMVLYSRFARRRIDPEIAALRERAGARRS